MELVWYELGGKLWEHGKDKKRKPGAYISHPNNFSFSFFETPSLTLFPFLSLLLRQDERGKKIICALFHGYPAIFFHGFRFWYFIFAPLLCLLICLVIADEFSTDTPGHLGFSDLWYKENRSFFSLSLSSLVSYFSSPLLVSKSVRFCVSPRMKNWIEGTRGVYRGLFFSLVFCDKA